ncbi:MAG TPA: nucleoside diphosphate kinase regulator [Blastocatellia bacterium]
MEESAIYVTEFDLKRLSSLLDRAQSWGYKDRASLIRLGEKLERAHVVSPREIPGDVVTMNSQVRIRDLKSNEEKVLTLVFPHEADYERGNLSILAPIGMALLGYRAGEIVEWKVPAGVRRLKIEQALYQPEAAGDYHL